MLSVHNNSPLEMKGCTLDICDDAEYAIINTTESAVTTEGDETATIEVSPYTCLCFCIFLAGFFSENNRLID